MLTGACIKAAGSSPCFAKMGAYNLHISGGGEKYVAVKIYEKDGRMCIICKIPKKREAA